MNQQAPDFPTYVEQTQKSWDKPIGTAFDEDGVPESVVRDVIEELEILLQDRPALTAAEYNRALRFQARRLLK